MIDTEEIRRLKETDSCGNIMGITRYDKLNNGNAKIPGIKFGR